jgi:hypothetical protein
MLVIEVHRHRSSPPAHTLAHYRVEHQVERVAQIKGGNMSTATVPEAREGYFPHWKLKTTGVIMPEERRIVDSSLTGFEGLTDRLPAKPNESSE